MRGVHLMFHHNTINKIFTTNTKSLITNITDWGLINLSKTLNRQNLIFIFEFRVFSLKPLAKLWEPMNDEETTTSIKVHATSRKGGSSSFVE